MNQPRVVYILTWCNDVKNLYGSTLIFKTLRVGFPTTPVYVIDNQSISEAKRVFRQKADECSATFVQLKSRIRHYRYFEEAIRRQESGTAIFVDPDICFWENVESWQFDTMLAGRLIPKHYCQITNAMTHPRLHTSFLWINDVNRFREEIGSLSRQHRQFSAFQAVMCRIDDDWHYLDCGASIYSALPKEMHSFDESQLDAYDHLFCGSHPERGFGSGEGDFVKKCRQAHQSVQQDYTKLKGAWRWQQEYFDSARVVGRGAT